MEGWIKLHRKTIGWEWYSDMNAKSLFIHCLLKANIKDNKWHGITIKKGQFFTSLGNLSEDLGLSVKQIRTSIRKLESTGDIKHEGASKGAMITVCKYETYQWNGQAKGHTLKKDVRAQEFKEKVSEYLSKYDQVMLDEFVSYWCESGDKDLKLRFEKQTSFQIARRLVTWKKNSKNYDKGNKGTTGSIKNINDLWPDQTN